MEWLIWLVVIAVFVVRGLLKADKSVGADRARLTTRQARHEQRQQARQLSTGWQPPPPAPPAWPPAPALDKWFPAPLPQPVPTAEVVATPAPDAQERFDDLREAAQQTAQETAQQKTQETAQETAQPVPSQLNVAAPADRYVGSAALESTLDSTIESSLFGATGGALTSSVLPGAAGLTLPVELEAQVRVYLDARHEVAAVRLVCDELDVGILDALRAVRSVAGLPSP